MVERLLAAAAADPTQCCLASARPTDRSLAATGEYGIKNLYPTSAGPGRAGVVQRRRRRMTAALPAGRGPLEYVNIAPV